MGQRQIGCVASPNASIARVTADLLIWRLLLSFGSPFRRLVAVCLLFGRNLYTLAEELQRWILSSLGWLSAPPSTAILRHLGTGFLQTRRWHFGAAGLVALAAFRSLFAKWRELTSVHYRHLKRQKDIMATAQTYEEWASACDTAEKLLGGLGLDARWRQETQLYDRRLLMERVQHLRAVKKSGDVHEMMFAVRADLLRNLGNMCNSEIHEKCASVPLPIWEYTKEVKYHLDYLTEYRGHDLTIEDKLTFLRETRHAFGRTALVLSGGGALGAFHVGVVKALFEQDLLPRVISGSSAGSIVAATIATRNNQELQDLFKDGAAMDYSFFSNSTLPQFVRHFLLKGTLQDVEVFQKRLRRLLGDATFLEAFMHSGRILNVAVSPADTNEPARVLNYLSAPHVLVWSAVSCSSAFPFLFLPQDLLARNRRGQLVRFNAESVQQTERRWRDGSLEEDLPMRSLSEMFNVNYFLVSQTNPHIVPALNLKKRVNRTLGNVVETEWKHRCRQLMSIFPGMRWLKCFSQPWEGDVTIVLPSSYMQIQKSITNPSPEDLLEASLQGERGTWEKMAAIRANCGTELTIDSCLAKLSRELKTKKLAEARSQSSSFKLPPGRSLLKARTPSWINLQAYGMPTIPSDEHLLERQDSMRSEQAVGSPSAAQPGLLEARGLFHKGLSLSGLSDSLRAPGIPMLDTVKEQASSADSSDVDETDTPPCEDAPAAMFSTEEDTARSDSFSNSSETSSIFLGLPPAPGKDRLESAESLMEALPDVYSRGSMSALDCCDRSVNIWETLIPLAACTVNGQGLDVIAP